MLKSRFALVVLVSLLILGIASFTYFNRKQPLLATLPASVSRDCAPWDGGAFTVKVTLPHGKEIHISIWQSPDIDFPKSFSFPDNTGQVGNALLIHQAESPEMLSGSITFQRADGEMPVEGWFRLRSGRGEQFEGQFRAEWDDQIALCG